MEEVENMYGGRVRVRVCGVLRHQEQVLLLNHRGLNHQNRFWTVPGGGLEPGEHVVGALRREFMEETHLDVQVHELLRVQEHIAGRLHAVELYFRVTCPQPNPQLGSDPEGNLLEALRWFNAEEILTLPKDECPPFLHQLLFTHPPFTTNQ